jgi:hypothetical protein
MSTTKKRGALAFLCCAMLGCQSGSTPAESDGPSSSADGGHLGDGSAAPNDAALAPSDSGGAGELGDLSGRWEGTAQVVGLKYLKTGSFPAVLHLVQSGARVRGILDVNENAAMFAEWFGYYLEGTVAADGRLSLELTDRTCAAGDPGALCMPRWGETKSKVFDAVLQSAGLTLAGSSPTPKTGVSYPADVPIEAPFVALSLTFASAPVVGEPEPLAGRWKGPFNPPESVVFAGMRMFGENEITFESTADGRLRLARFDNNDVNIYPNREDVILADSFAYDPATRRFWFVEAGSIYGTWLWIGEVRGNRIVGHFVSEPLEDRVWHADAMPTDPFDVPFTQFEGTFALTKQ